MPFWTRILYRLGLRADPRLRRYELDGEMRVSLSSLADRDGRSEGELASELFTTGMATYRATQKAWQDWQSLTEREKDVAALVSLGYDNRQIGIRLGVSGETIKVHLRSTLVKFNLRSRSQLAARLADWDFSAWKEHRPTTRRS